MAITDRSLLRVLEDDDRARATTMTTATAARCYESRARAIAIAAELHWQTAILYCRYRMKMTEPKRW